MNHSSTCRAPSSSQHLTKAELGKILDVTPRTVQSYKNSGVLPLNEWQGRRAVWTVKTLAQFLADESNGSALDVTARARLVAVVQERAGSDAPSTADAVSTGAQIAAGYLVDEVAEIDIDLRSRIYEINAVTRAAARDFHADARSQPHGSDEGRRLYELAKRNWDAVDVNESRLKQDFLPAHGAGQLLGAEDFENNPLFNICNSRLPRESLRDETFRLADGRTMRYTGPELRQDDALVFAAMLRVASDVRVGRLVGFAPSDLCWTLFNDYSGKPRARLREIIKRLQSAKLTFEDFSVHLIGRFDFPKHGLWSVALDRDVVRLFADGRQVWMKLDKVLSYGGGIAGWVYRYTSAQTKLIPKKVEHLRRLSGSTATLDDFRSKLKKALNQLVAGGDLQEKWFIDKHDMLHWMKSPRELCVFHAIPDAIPL